MWMHPHTFPRTLMPEEFRPGNGYDGEVTSDISTGSYFIFKHETTTPGVENRSFKYGGLWNPKEWTKMGNKQRIDKSRESIYNFILKRKGDELWGALYYNSFYRNILGVSIKHDRGGWSHKKAAVQASPDHCRRGSKKRHRAMENLSIS